ncbi:MAG: ATP-grasp domain-containing protein, partial [Devosia sp.]
AQVLVRSMPSPAIELSALQARQNAAPAKRRMAMAGDGTALAGVIVLGGAHGSLAVARSLGRKGIPVWFIGDDHPIAKYSRYVKRRLTWNRFAPDEAVALLVELARNQGAAGWVLFPAGDTETQLVAQHHATLAEHFRLFTMPWETLKQLNDKSLLYHLASDVGVGFPRSYDHETGDMPGSEGFPVIIKPVSSERPNALTKDKAWLAETGPELSAKLSVAKALMGQGRVVVQEMIPGDGSTQFSYAGLWDQGREVAFLTARRTRQFPIDFGMTSSFVETVDAPEVAAAARQLLVATDFHGLTEIEFKYDAREHSYKVLDANTRAWAWIGLGGTAGVDFPYLAWQLATGQAVDVSGPARAATWLYPSRNILSIVQGWRRNGERPAWRTMLGASAYANFAWDDVLPGVIDLPIQAYRFARRFVRKR